MRKRTLNTPSCSVPSIQNAFEQFQKHNQLKNLAQGTIDFYSSKARKFFLFLGDTSLPIDSITKDTVNDYILYLKGQASIRDTTLNTHLRMVRTFLYWCMDNNYLPRFSIKLVLADEPLKEPYTAAELERLLKRPCLKTCSFAEYRNWVIINFLLGTGCRASTLTNLHIEDIDFSAGAITFRHMKTRHCQSAPLSHELSKILEEYLLYRDGKPSEPLFVSEYGAAMSVSAVGNAVWNYNHSRGVEKTSLHLFRHTYAKLYIQAGGDPFRLQKLLGHADLTMTRRYVALYADDLKANYDALNPLEQIKQNSRRSNKIAMKPRCK